MPDHEGSDQPTASMPGSSGQAGSPQDSMPALDLTAALGGLDRATRDFTRRLGETRRVAEPAPGHASPAGVARSEPAPIQAGEPRAYAPPARARPRADEASEARLREAEREAREYLERAKQRADSLVATMVGAVEQEAASIRRDAEEGMRTRWYQVETDARRHLEEARRVGDGMVAERRQRIAVLSEAITGRAEAISSGLEDAERVRDQFDAFVRALAVTASRIAEGPAAGRPRRLIELHDLPQSSRPSASAA